MNAMTWLWKGKGCKAGVGIVFEVSEDGSMSVASLVKDGPAERCGKIAAGDVLYEVDNTNVYRSGLQEVARMVVGKPGSAVTVGLKRGLRYEPDPIFRVRLVREAVDKVGEVESSWVNDLVYKEDV